MDKYKHICDLLTFSKESCHIVMLLPRQKDGFTTGEKWTRARHYFVSDAEQRLDKVNYIKKLLDEWEQGRIYTTYNPRSLKQWAKNLMYLIADSMVWGNYQWLMRGKWLIASCLKKKWTRYSKDYYMIDIDTKDKDVIDMCVDIADENYVQLFDTPNGHHMLVKPMDVRIFSKISEVEIKTDEFLFVDM